MHFVAECHYGASQFVLALKKVKGKGATFPVPPLKSFFLYIWHMRRKHEIVGLMFAVFFHPLSKSALINFRLQ